MDRQTTRMVLRVLRQLEIQSEGSQSDVGARQEYMP
jgi:hypothetical protein